MMLSDRISYRGNGSMLAPRNAGACRKHTESRALALTNEPVYNHYLLAADSSRKVDRFGRKHRKSMDKIVISPTKSRR